MKSPEWLIELLAEVAKDYYCASCMEPIKEGEKVKMVCDLPKFNSRKDIFYQARFHGEVYHRECHRKKKVKW